jgi:hypothetical protein
MKNKTINEMERVEAINDLVARFQNHFKSRKPELIEENLKEQEFLESEDRYWGTFETPIKTQIEKELRILLLDSYFKCYHCTRLIDRDVVRKDGIKTLNVKDFKIKVQKATETYLTESQKLILNDCFAKYRDGKFGRRENLIWFVSNLNLTESRGCQDFFNYFGGEVTRRILAEHENEFFPILEKIGKPFIIECSMGFNEIKSAQQDSLIDAIIDGFICESIDINWEFSIEKDLLPGRIIEIYEKKIYAR